MTTSFATDATDVAEQLRWLLSRLCASTPGMRELVAVADDGQSLVHSDGMGRAEADRLSAVCIAFGRLAGGAGRAFDRGRPSKILTDFERGYLMVSRVNAHCLLGAVANHDANLAELAYDISVFAQQIASALTPVMVRDIRSALPTD